MDPADLQRLMEETATLQRMQVTPDAPEALASIPALRVADLPRENRRIPAAVERSKEARVLCHDLPTNAIAYLDIGFDLTVLPAADVPYAGLLGALLVDMGTERDDFVALARRIGKSTGGIHASAINALQLTERSTVSRFVIRAKSTVAQFDELLAILHDVLSSLRLDDRERFKQIALEEKAGLESGLVHGGRHYVNLRLRSAFNAADWANEQMDGISSLFFLRSAIDRTASDWPGLLGDLRRVWAALVMRRALVANLTVDAAHRTGLQAKLETFIAELPEGRPASMPPWPVVPAIGEGLTVPTQVNFVGKGVDLYALGHRLHGSWLTVQNWLNTTYLWERVRVQGGAYGGSCTFDPLSGAFCYLSYRDPNLTETVTAYDGAGPFLRSHLPDQAEVDRTIIGVIGSMDAYMLPDAKGYTSLSRFLTGMTDERRQQLREEVLAATPQDFARFADVLEDVARAGRVVVIGSPQAIQRANAGQGADWLQTVKVL